MADQKPLTARDCVPCHGGVAPLTETAIEAYAAHVPGWTVRNDPKRIERRLVTKDFAQAFAMVSRIAALAEAEGHHPDVSFGWGYVAVSLHTHVIKGLHANDFILAAKIDEAIG